MPRLVLPQGTGSAPSRQRDPEAIDERTNDRPCPTLGWMIPNEAWSAQIQLLRIVIAA